MLTRSKLALALSVVLLAAFLVGVAHLFVLRFQAGDIYPPYSTLRADPLGAKALHDSLRELPGVETVRHFRAVKRLPDGEPFTFFYPGIPIEAQWEAKELADLEWLTWQGMRLVLTVAPVTEAPDEPKSRKAKKEEDDPNHILSHQQLAERWGFQFGFHRMEEEEMRELSATAHGEAAGNRLAWRTVTFFQKLDPDWRVLYECEGQPVVIERAFGSGTIVLCADSYFLSNEALRRHRAPAFLAWLAGGNRRIVFDELHHGISDQPGVMTLARRYGMLPFFAALLLLAALFVWQQAVPFVPPVDPDGDADAVLVGKDASAGFVNLLRRNIPPGQILTACWEAWRQSFAHQTRASRDQLARAESLAGAPPRDVPAAFREISSLLNPRQK